MNTMTRKRTTQLFCNQTSQPAHLLLQHMMRLRLWILTSFTVVGLRCIIEATTVMINAAPGGPEFLVSSPQFPCFRSNPRRFSVSVGAAVPFGVVWCTVYYVPRAFQGALARMISSPFNLEAASACRGPGTS